MTDNKDDKTLSVAGKKTLTLKPTGVNQGTVRQDMGRGRTKSVVVETVKRRPTRPQDEKPPITPIRAPEPVAPVAVAQPPRPAAPAPAPAPPGGSPPLNWRAVDASVLATVALALDGRAPPVAAPTPPKPKPRPVPQPLPQPVATPPPEPSTLAPVLPPSPPAPPAPAEPVVAAAPPSPPAPPAPPRIELPISSADYLNNPRPPYPPLSKRLGEQGKVVVRVYIDVDGTASRAEVRQSSGFERLDQTAVQTVLRWRYVPGKRAGVPEAMWFNVPISFVLE